MVNNVISNIYLITIILLFVISLITTFKRSSDNQTAGIMLMTLNWLFLFGSFVAFLMFSGNIVYLPHFLRTAHISTLLYLPLSYLYISQSFQPRRLRYSDLLHLVPLIIFLVDYFPLYIKSGDEKIALYQQLNFYQRDIYFREGWFMPAKMHVVIRYVQMIIYWVFQYRLLQKSIKTGGEQLRAENSDQIKWLTLFTYSQLFIILPPLLTLILGWELGTRFLIVVSSMATALIQCYYLFSHPEILYGLKGAILEVNNESINSTSKHQIDAPVIQKQEPLYYLSESMLDSMQLVIEDYMEKKKPYLMPRYSLIDLANETDYSTHQISAYINKRCGMNFYSCINQYRINYCIERFKMKEYIDKTLEAIANESGFQSRATFIRAFKKETNLTPSEYIKTL